MKCFQFFLQSFMLALVLLTMNAGCISDPVVSKVLFEDERRLVRLDVTYRSGGQEHTHPVSLDPEVLMALLQTLTVQGQVSPLSGRLGMNQPSSTQALSDEQLQFLSPLLAQAFERASPLEEIVFFINEARGSNIREVISGGIYAQGKDLHLILANYRHPVAGELMMEKARTNPLTILGESWYRVEPGPHGRVEYSPSWEGVMGITPQHLVIPLINSWSSIENAPMEGIHQDPDKAPSSVINKLRLLRKLRKSGLLTQQEFETKQRQVLDSKTVEPPL